MTSGTAQTRAFLFADLRGYSAFTEAHGDRAAAVLMDRYRDLVRAEIVAHRGAEIRTEGDSFYVVFDSVSDAVLAAIAIRDRAGAINAAGDGPPIRVGLGIHAGEVEDRREGIVSSAVNIAARVCSVAAPGEVLVTDTVRSLTRTFLSVSYTARRRRRLKGIAEPIALFSVDAVTGASVVARRGSLGIALAVVAAAAVVVATVASIVLANGTSTASASSPGPHSVAASAPLPSNVVASPATDEFPNAAEAVLLDRLPSSMVRSCERAPVEGAPIYQRELTLSGSGRASNFVDTPLTVTAGLTCFIDLNRVLYWNAIGPANVDAVFARRIAVLGVQVGNCAETAGRYWETWEAGAHAGKLVCYTNADGAAVLEWTYGNEAIYAVATRRNGDAAALYAWWRQTGRIMGR